MTAHLRRRRVRRLRGDEGMTLIDVLMAVFLTSLIVGAVAAAIMVTLGPDQRSADQLVSSHDGQLASIWVPADLESAGPVDPGTDLAAAAPLACTGAVPGTNVLRLQWVQPDPAPRAFAVSYRVVTVGSEVRLVRASCTDGGAVRELVIARQLRDAGSAAAAVDGQRVTLRFTTSLGEPVAVTATRRTPAGGPTTTAPTTTLPPTTTSSTTTTTIPPTTTTTTAPTTTTTTAPTTTTTTSTSCTVQSVTATPSSIGRTGVFLGSGPLSGNVTVRVQTTGSGSCGTLTLRYETSVFIIWPQTATTTLTRSGNTWTGTIPGSGNDDAERFTAGTKELTVLRPNGDAMAPTGTLVVS